MKKIKTIDVNCKSWFDKVNGRSYFSGVVSVNYGTKSQQDYFIPFQYGYGDQYIHAGVKTLVRKGFLPQSSLVGPTRWARENGIILRHYLLECCRKKELFS